MAAKLNIVKRRRPAREITKGFRVNEAEARAIETIAENEDCDEAVLIRYALEQLPGWANQVKRAQLDIDASN